MVISIMVYIIIVMQKHPRVLSSPTYTTPVRAQKRTPLWEILEEETGDAITKTQLTFECDELPGESCGINWSNTELKALIKFTLLHRSENHWPTHHRMDYWSSAAGFVKMRSNTKTQRSSNCFSAF